jgi:NADPH-dependent curcumin reductase CurA
MALGTARVVDSRFDGLNQGDAVFGPVGAQTHAKLPGAMLQKLDESELPARCSLGVLGLATGMTAYAGMAKVAQIKEGDTVVVSAAAGGWFLRLSGCKKSWRAGHWYRWRACEGRLFVERNRM